MGADMKRIIPFGLAAVTTLFLIGEAQAADLVRPAYPVKAPVVAPRPASSWTGFYVGINGGIGGGKYDYSFAIVGQPGTASLNSSGGFGGGQIGYNYQFAPTWVAGIEADIEASGIEGNLSASVPGFVSLTGGTKLEYFGTVRGRIGYLVTPSALLYATGGWAYGQNTSSLHLTGPILGPLTHSSSDTRNKSGWTIGGGLEYALTPHFSAKFEYLYLDLGTDTIASGLLFPGVPASISEKTTVQTIKVGLNYRFGSVQTADFPVKAPIYKARPAPAVSWTGFYVGINGGFGGDKFEYPFTIAGVGGSASFTSSGWFGGGQIGYNYEFSPAWVAGIEADIEAADIDGMPKASAAGLSLRAGTKLDWFGTVRGRIGYLLTPSALLYGTGGWAYGHTTSSINIDPGIFSVSYDHDKSGWAAGGGLEYALTPHFSVNAEYLYVDLGTDTIASGTILQIPSSISVKTTVHTMKIGLNYRF